MESSIIQKIYDTSRYAISRLPSDVKPEHYNIKLIPNLKDFTFTGIIDIVFEQIPKESTITEIILNAADIDIKNGYIVDLDEKRYDLKQVIYNDTFETVGLKFNNDGSQSSQFKYLRLGFSGILNDRMKGFYRSKIQVDNQIIYAAATQLCAPDARRAFPCFDEPCFKASFDLTIIYDSAPIEIGSKTYVPIALSNADLMSQTATDDGKTIAKFETSPKMSTYLLAFVVGPFEYIEAKRSLPPEPENSKCRLRVYTCPGKKELGRFALDVAEKSLKFYEDYFNIPYPLSKLDLLAIPDLAYGAMENWGLITYRETALLFDHEKSSTHARQRIATVVAHEIAHQWFGNLVTMNWWTDLWLNEGFASFMQYLCPDEIFPHWDLWSQFVSDVVCPAMQLDSLHNSHPIEVNIGSVSEIDEIFDRISYQKGCSAIRMLCNYMGNESFRLGITQYLNKFSYANATTKDLWQCLEVASHKPISKIMSSWTSQTGYPWIEVKILEESNGNGDLKLILKQEKFTANGELSAGEENIKWIIPLSIASGSANVKQPIVELMEEREKTIVLPGQGTNWLKINKDTINYHRTAYPPNLLQRLTELMRKDFVSKQIDVNFEETLSPMDRLGIQNDYFALCQSGRVLSSDLIQLLACYVDETNYTVWRSIDSCMFWLANLYKSQGYELHQEELKKFGCQLYSKIYAKLSWDKGQDENHTDSMLRALVINRLVHLGDKVVIERAKNLFENQISSGDPILADLKTAVYEAIAIYGDDKMSKNLLDIYDHATLEEEKSRVGCALGYATNPERLKKVIEFVLSDRVRGQNLVPFITSIGQNCPVVAWQMFKENFDFLVKKTGTAMLPRLIASATGCLCDESKACEITEFFEQNHVANAQRTIQQSIETIRLNAKWLARQKSDTHLISSFTTSFQSRQ